MMQNWLVIASAEHVRFGRMGGFIQVCHGKEKPLRRIKSGDWVIYYSPTITYRGKDKLQSFTTLGRVKAVEPYQVDMGNGFCPFRRDVTWLTSHEVSIIPLLDILSFTKNKKNWGYQFRFGLFTISEHDRKLITDAMTSPTINE